MRLFGREMKGIPKALVILAAVLLVATGLCGLQVIINGKGGPWTAVLLPLGIVESLTILVSAAGIVVVLIAWAVRGLYRIFIRPEEDGEKGS